MFYPDVISGALPVSAISQGWEGWSRPSGGRDVIDGTMRHRRLRVPRATASHACKAIPKGPIQDAVTSVFCEKSYGALGAVNE